MLRKSVLMLALLLAAVIPSLLFAQDAAPAVPPAVPTEPPPAVNPDKPAVEPVASDEKVLMIQTVTRVTNAPGIPISNTTYIKGNLVRIEQNQKYVLLDFEQKIAYWVDPATKMTFKFKLDFLRNLRARFPNKGLIAAEPAETLVEKTKDAELIGDQMCTKYIIKHGPNTVINLWAAPKLNIKLDLKPWEELFSGMNMEPVRAAMAEKVEGWPLKIEATMLYRDVKVTIVQESKASWVDAGQVSFLPPADAKIIDPEHPVTLPPITPAPPAEPTEPAPETPAPPATPPSVPEAPPAPAPTNTSDLFK